MRSSDQNDNHGGEKLMITTLSTLSQICFINNTALFLMNIASNIYIYIYIYIERERQRQRYVDKFINKFAT